jgi:hypothetical protein
MYDGCVQTDNGFIEHKRKPVMPEQPVLHSERVMSDFDQLQLADAVVNHRGAKSCALTNDGSKFVHTVGSREEPLTSPFGASSFNDENTVRKTIEFRLPAEWANFWDGFDAWAVTYITCHSNRLFGKPMSIEQVRDGYKPCVTRRGTYAPTLRCKITLSGSNAVRCWSPEGVRVDVPDEFRGMELVPQLTVMHLYVMGREFGWVSQIGDLMCSEVSQVCPF